MTTTIKERSFTERSFLPVQQEILLPTFDLTVVRNHMIRRHPELNHEMLALAESEYLNFLRTCKANPGQNSAPGHLADKFWHAHILHTMLYTQQCKEYFGYYLHHTSKAVATDQPMTAGECFCNEAQPGDTYPSGGGVSIRNALKPTESCG